MRNIELEPWEFRREGVEEPPPERWRFIHPKQELSWWDYLPIIGAAMGAHASRHGWGAFWPW